MMTTQSANQGLMHKRCGQYASSPTHQKTPMAAAHAFQAGHEAAGKAATLPLSENSLRVLVDLLKQVVVLLQKNDPEQKACGQNKGTDAEENGGEGSSGSEGSGNEGEAACSAERLEPNVHYNRWLLHRALFSDQYGNGQLFRIDYVENSNCDAGLSVGDQVAVTIDYYREGRIEERVITLTEETLAQYQANLNSA